MRCTKSTSALQCLSEGALLQRWYPNKHGESDWLSHIPATSQPWKPQNRMGVSSRFGLQLLAIRCNSLSHISHLSLAIAHCLIAFGSFPSEFMVWIENDVGFGLTLLTNQSWETAFEGFHVLPGRGGFRMTPYGRTRLLVPGHAVQKNATLSTGFFFSSFFPPPRTNQETKRTKATDEFLFSITSPFILLSLHLFFLFTSEVKYQVPSLPRTWHLKWGPSKRSLIFQVPSHRCHVSWTIS